MANKKDDDFDFKWDDDASFDSELDNFGGDVNEYHPDELKDAKKDRNPVINKLKSIAPTIHDAGSAVLAGAGKQIGRSIEDNVPEVYQTYTNATYVLSEAETLRNQVTDKVKPWWNDTKRTLRKLSQQLEGQMPFGLDKKILKLVGEEERDQQYKQPSKEDMRREQMNSNINNIFELQMQKSMEQQKDNILNRTLDRRVANIHHKENAGFLSKIAENAVFQHAFTSSVFTAYLKKDLELKYKHFYIAEDTLEVFKNHARAVDNKLDAVIKNTALPEADKIYMRERISTGLKNKLADTFNNKLQNYFGEVSKKILRHVSEGLDLGKILTDALGSQVDMLEIMNDPEMAAMGGMGSEPSLFTKKGLMHLALGNIGGFFAKRALKPLWNKVPQETQELLRQYFRKGRNGLALLMDDLRSGRIKGVPDELKSLLQAITPKLNDKLDKGFVLNEGFQTLDQGAKFTTKFVKTVEDIIPGYLAMQTRYLEMMATNKDSGIQTWNFKTMSFENEKDRWARTRERIDVSNDAGGYRLKTAVVETRKMLEHKAQRYGATGDLIMDRVKKSLQTYHPEIELFIVNLAYSDEYYQVKPDEFVKELDAIVKAESMDDLVKMPLYRIGFEDIEHVKQVAGFWLDMLADRSRDGKTEVMPDKAAIVSFNNRLLDERANITRSYTAIAEDELRQGNFDVLRALGAKVDSKGNFVYNLRALRRNEFKTTNKIDINKDISKEEIEKYNETFQYREWNNANDKNALLERLKNFLGNMKNMNPRDIVDSGGKGMFAWFWKKFKGENKEKEMEKAWEKVLHNVDVTKDFLVNTYNDATDTLEGWYKQLHISSVQELLDIIANADSTNAIAWRLLKRMLIVKNAEGKNELRDLSDLDAAEWYDWFSHLSNPSSAADQFNKGTAASNLLLTLFPLDIKALIFAINNDPDLVKKMKLVNQQFNSNDPETVKQRQDELKKLAGAAIADTKKKIESRSTAYSTMQSAKTDELSKNIAHQVKKAKEDRAYEMNQISTTGFNGTVEHSYAQQQLDVLRHMDAVLGDFYHAFISDKFRADERKRMKKTYGSVKDNGEYRHDNGPASKEDKIEFYFNQLNDLYDARNAAKVSKNEKDENEATKKIVNIMKEIYGSDKVNAENLHDYVVRFDSEYNELKNKDDYVADNRSKIRVNETAEFNPYTLRTEKLSAEDMARYKSVAEHDAAIINDIIAKADEHNRDGLKLSDSQKSLMRTKEQRKLFITRAREAFLDQLKNMPNGQFIKAIPYASEIPQIGDTANEIRDLINNNRAALLSDVNYYIPIPLIYSILAKDYVKIIDNVDKNVQKYWRYAIKQMLTSRMDSLHKYSGVITPLEMMGTLIQPVDNVLEFITQLHDDVNDSLRTNDISSVNKSIARYRFMDKSEQEVKKSFDIDFDDLIQLASAKSMADYTNINKQLSEKYKRDIDIDNDTLIEALSRVSDYRNAEKSKYAQRHNNAGYSSKISDIKKKLNTFSNDTSKFKDKSSGELDALTLDALSRRYSNDIEFRRTSDIIESIRNNFSTYEDINENGAEALQRMLTGLLQHHEFAEGTTIDDLFEAITGKDYNTTVYGEETDDITSIINNLKGIQPQPEILALPLANSHRKKLNGQSKKTKNKHRLKNARKHASGGSYPSSTNRFRELAREYIGLTKLWDGKSMPDPAVLQKMQTGLAKFEYSSDKDYVNFRPYFKRRIQLDSTKALYDFLQRHPEYRDRHLESLVNNVCLCMRTASESQAQSPLNDADKLTLQGAAELLKLGPSARIGRNAAHSIILYPDNYPLMLPVLYHELGHIVDRNANALQPRALKELTGYGAIDPGMVGHAAKGARYEHHADWYGIRKTYESDNGPGKVHEYLRTLMKSVEGDKHHGDIYVKDSENAKPRIAIIGRGVDIGAYAYKIVRNDGTIDWIPLDDTYHISRAVYQIKDVYTGDTLANPIQVISIEDIRKTQKSMTQGGTVGLCAYSPDTNDYALATDDSDMKYRTNLMYRALRRYGMDPNKARKEGKEPIKEMYAKGGNFDLNEHMQLDDAAAKYIEKAMSKPGGPTAAEFKKIQKLHAEALRRFITRNPSMRNAAAEQYLNNGIPVLQWDTNKLSSLSPYDQQVGKMLFGDFYKRGGRYMNAGGRAHGTSIKGKNANAVIELGYDTPIDFNTLFTLDHESQHILDKRAQPGSYNLAKYAGREHIGVGAPWEHYANLGAIKSQIGRGNIDQLIEMMQYLNETANDSVNDNRYLAKQIRRMLHKAGVDTSAYSTTTKSTAQEVDDGTEDIIRQLCKQGRNPKDWDTVSNQEKIQLLYWLKENKANLAGMGINIADSSIDKLIAKYSGSIKKYAKGGNIALAYSKQLLEDKKLDDELRKKYKYGKYFDEKYSSAELMQIRSTLSPQEQQIFDAECADFNNNWLPRFVNRLKPFRSSRWEKHTNGIPVIDANKINQNIKFSPWDREYINALLGALTTTPALADPTSKLIWARSNNQNKLLKGVLLHEASHIVDKDALPTANISIQDAHSGKGARFEKRADWNAVKRLLAAGDINGVRGFINWLQRFAKEEKNDPHRHITDVGWRADLLTRAVKRYGYDLNQGLKHKRYAKGDNFDAADVIQNYTNKYNEISGITRSRYKDKASNSLIESTLAGKDYDDIIDLENEMSWDAGDDGQLQNAIDYAKLCDKLEYLLRKAPILDKTDYYRQWLNIPSTVHVAAIHLKEDTIKKHCPNLDADFWSVLAEAKRNCPAMCAIKDPRYKNSGYIIRRLTASDKQYKALELFAIAHELGHIVAERGTIYGTGGDLAHSGRGHYTEKHADMYGLKRYLTDVGPADLSHIINWLAWTASSSRGDDFAESKSNGSDGRWRSDLIRRYIRMRKHKGDPLYANFKDEDLQSKFRNKYANGDAISFDLPIDQYGGYVDQPTEILGGSGIAGEAGGETIIPHKYNERFKELIYRCLKDTVGENMARRVLRMMKPSDTTQDKLGINLPDASDSRMFAKGGFFKRWWNKLFSHDEEPDKKDQPESNEKRKKLAEELARIMEQLADADEDNASGPTADLFRRRDELEKELNGLDNPIKTEDKPKEEYTQRHEPTSIRNILLNIMESNEAIYRKMGDGLLVVDLASMLDKLKNTELLNKLKSLKIGERIKNFIFGAYGTGKGLVHGAYNIGKNIVKTAAMNVGSFGRHMFTNKVCDVYLKSKIEGEKHGELKISASELEHGAIFADEECTKPIYSVADIHPPVYRKVNKNGTETPEKAINEEEAKDGLVDVEGNSLLRFGGKIGRFLRHVATTPLKAILTHKNWERLKGLGSSIMSGIGSGVNGLLDAYCDVYTTKKLEKPLVRGDSIKEGRLVRVLEGGKIKVVPTVFDIDGPCWLLVDDETNPGERKLGNNEVITETDITDGLCHKDGSPIESTKIAKATAMLRRAIGAVGNGIASLTGGAFGIGATVIGWAWNKGKAAAGWVKDRVKDAFTAKNPYIDVYVIRNNAKKIVMHADELKTNKATHVYCYIDKETGKESPVLSAYGIDAPVYDMRGTKKEGTDEYDGTPVEIISQDDVDKQAIYDIAGNQLTKWAGRSLAGKIGTAALGAVKVGWKALKGLGKGLWNVGKTVLGSVGTLLGEGGATITGFFTKAWSSTLDFFKNSVISRKDLQEIVGDRLLDIYGLLYKYMPRRKYIEGPDLDNNGAVDGSWEDYEQKRKEREAKREQSDQQNKDGSNAEHDDRSFWSKVKDAFRSGFGGDGDDSSGGFFSNLLDMYMGYLGFKDAKGLFGKLFGRKGAAGATAATNVARAATVTEAAMSGKKGLFKRFASFINGLFARPQNVNGVVKAGGIYNAKKWLKELFFGNMSSGGEKRGIVNVIRGLFHKKGAAAAGEAAASSTAEAGKMATAWNWFKGLFGKGAAGKAAEKEIAALQAKAAAHHAKFMGAAAGKAATNAAAKAAAKGVLGRIGARLAAATTANLSGPVIGQIISAGMYLWTGYEIIKYFATDSSKVKGLRPVRFKAYGVSPKYWEAIEDLETDTFSEFKAGHAEGVPVDRLKKFGYKIDFLDASEMAYGGDKLEYIKTWYRFKFVPFYQKYAQSIIIACKLDPNSQPKGDDIPDEVYSTIILQLTKGFDRINVGPLKELKLDKVSYEKWLAKKREKDREEGLESGKYNNKDLADNTLTGAASKLVGNVSDHLGYAWNEFKHGNILNAIGAVGKAHRAATVKLVAYVAQVVGGFVPGLFMGLFHNEKSTNEKAWDEVRFKLYGLDKAHVSKREYERISKLIKDFEIHQIHVIDGEEKMVEEDLRDLAEEIFTERVRKNIKSRLSTSGLSTIATSKDLYPESTGFVISWYKRIFLPIFALYANGVRAACGGKPGDNIVIDSIPADQRADLLKEFERQAKAMLAKNIDTEILRLSPDGLFDYLAMRSEEDIAEFAKDSKDLVSEDELGFSAKLSRNLDDAGNDLAKAWSLKFKDPGKALGLAIKGVGKAIWGTFKTVGKSIGQSVSDFLHGSANEHRWETRFFDYGFTSRSGSSDVFKNQNLRAMEEFEAEAGKQLLEDNTGKPDEQYFVRIALNSGFIEDCCQKVFGSGSGIGEYTLAATNTRTLNSAILKYSTPIGWIDTLGSKFKNKVFGINTLSELKEKLIKYLVGNVKDNADPNKAKLNIKAKIGDIINYLDFWWTVRFKPVFDTFIGVINGYGVEPDDIDVDNIPEESRKQAYDEYKKEVAAVLKKDNVLVYNLSAAGCAAYLKQLDEYRKDAKDGVINDARNPLAKYYKEKEEEFENTVVAAVVANAPALDKEEKFRVAKSLAKASMEIDSELNDVNIMSKYAAKDILAKLGVIDLIHPSRSVKDTIYSILLRLTVGENKYDTIAKNSSTFFRDDTLGKLFVDFLENAHKCLYGTDVDNLDKYLKEFAKSCAQSGLFVIKYKGVDMLLPNCEYLNAWINTEYRNISIDDPVAVYFSNWFAYRFMPYYAYFVTLVNKATDEKDPKKFPDISKLSVMRRNYIIDKLAKSEHKGLISFKARSMKIDGYSIDAYFRKLNETEGNAKAIGQGLRSNGRKFLEERRKELEKQLAEDREKRKLTNQSKEDVKRYVEDKNLADVDVLSTGRPGALIGGKNTKQKGRSCTEEERQYIYNFLTSELGLTPEQAAAVMGNMMAESTMSPTAINKDGGGDGAHGLFQWRGPRLKGGGGYTGLIPFAKALGLDPYSVEAQMKYFKHEIETVPYERSQFNKYVRSIVTDPRNPNKTIAQAAVGFRKGFERCGDYETRDSERVGYAKDFYRKYGPGEVPSHLPNTSVLDTATADNTGTTGAVTNTPPVATSQSTNVQADIATAPANTTSSVGVSGSKQPTYSGSYGNVSDQTKKACDYVTAHSHERSLGKCARYVANALQAAGYKFNRQPSAYMYHTNGILTKMGFTCMGSTNARPQAGDVCVINRFKGHPHGHICMYNGQQWISDFRQRTASPYKAGAPGGIWYYRPNGSTTSSTNNATTNIVSNVNSDIVKNNQIVYEHAVNKVRNNSVVEQVKPTPTSVISNTSTEGTNDNIRTLSAMQTDITNANSGNAPIVSELKLISSILSAFKGDVSGFIHMLTNTTGLAKTGDTTKPTTTVTNNKSISDEGLRILVDKLNELAQLITTTNPNAARTSPKYHARDDYMQGYPLQTNKVSS